MKNPWMSMWLSAANTWTGAARGLMTAEMRRQQNAFLKEATRAPGSRKSGASAKAKPARRRTTR
jgi:hypothetical protein